MSINKIIFCSDVTVFTHQPTNGLILVSGIRKSILNTAQKKQQKKTITHRSSEFNTESAYLNDAAFT